MGRGAGTAEHGCCEHCRDGDCCGCRGPPPARVLAVLCRGYTEVALAYFQSGSLWASTGAFNLIWRTQGTFI